jgi:DME family drug/metabolite transporter
MGTVFGRYVGRKLAFEHVSTVRFGFGLIASAVALPLVGAAAFSNLHDSFWIAVLALVTGFLALNLYYYGLRRTPALLAALGELAFPVTAALVGIYVFDDQLRWTQWLGVAITVGVISLLPVRRRQLVRVPPRPEAGLAAT